jgi:hypothetical protein
MSDCSKTLSKQSEYVTRCIGEQAVIVPVREGVGDLGSIYTLNELGTRIWQLLDGKTALQEIVDAIVDDYEVSREEAERDIADFLSVLETAGLVRSSESSAG